MHIDEIQEGWSFETEPQIITQDMIERFADLTGDHNPLHLDEDAAERGPFEGIVSHGRLSGDVAIGMLPYDLVEGAMLLEDKTEYLRAVRPGDHIRSEFTVLYKDNDARRPEIWYLDCEIKVLNQDDKTVAKMRLKMRVSKN